MRRFLLLTVVGAVALIGGPSSLSLGLYPDHLSSFGVLAQGCAALVVGTAIFISGMLGLVERYEKSASQVIQLLNHRQVPRDLELGDAGQLAHHSNRVWNGYRRTTGGIILFLAGVLSLMIGLRDVSLTSYMTGVVTGIVVFGIASFLLAFHGLRVIHRSHVAVSGAAETLAAQPEITLQRFPDEPPVEERSASRRPVFASRPHPRHLENRRYSTGHARTPG